MDQWITLYGKHLLDAAPLAVLAFNEDGNLAFANHPARLLLGWETPTAEPTWRLFWERTSLGLPPLPMVSGRFPEVQVITPSGPVSVEFHLADHDGVRLLFLVESLPRFMEAPGGESAAADSGMILLDQRDTVRWLSRGAAALLAKEEWEPGEPFASFARVCCEEDVLPEELLSRVRCGPTLLFASGRHLQIRALPMLFPPQQRDLLLQIQDVSARERLQERERFTRIGELAAAAVHEIKNPLTTIRGFLQLLGEQGGIDHGYLGIILDEIDRVTAMIGDLLALSKPTAPSSCDASRVVKEVVALLQAEYRLQHVRVEPLLPELLPPVGISAPELKQVLLNLLQNASDALSDSPGGRIRIEGETLTTGVRLHVRDNGPGIPHGLQATIFQPFFTTKSQGTGLGLSVCKQILEQAGGTLSLTASIPGDTCFTLAIPLA